MAYLKALTRAMRPLTVRLSAAGVLVGGMLAGRPNAQLVIAILITMLLVMYGNLLNDWFDWEIDERKGKDHSPLTKRDLLIWSLAAAFAILLFSAALSGWIPKSLVLANLVILVLYNTRVGAPTGLFGNAQIAYLSASTLLLGAIVTKGVNLSIGVLFCVVFLVILAREVVKDIEDVEADKDYRRTLPMRIGIPLSASFANSMLGMAAGVIVYYTVNPWSPLKFLNLIPAFLFLQAFHTNARENSGVQKLKQLAYAGLITGVLTVLVSK